MELLRTIYKALFGGQHASVFLLAQQVAIDDLRAKHKAATGSLIKRNESVNKAKLAVLEELALQHAALADEIKLLKGE